MDLFGQNTTGLQLLQYKPPEPPEGVWRAIAQQKTTAGAEGMIAMGHGISSLGGSIKGALDKQAKEAENSGEQNISFMRNEQGNLVPTSSGDGGFLFGANGPSNTDSWSPFNLFNMGPQEHGTAGAIGTAGPKTGANVASMANAQNVSSIYAANSLIGNEIQQKRQQFEGDPEGFKGWFTPYAEQLRDSLGGKQGLAVYNAAWQHFNQHYPSMVSNKFTQDTDNQWDTIGAGIKADTKDLMEYARQFPGSFEDLQKSGPYKKVAAGYKSLNLNPVFKGKMNDGTLADTMNNLNNDLRLSHAIGTGQRIVQEQGLDAGQQWAVDNYRNKGKDKEFTAIYNSLGFQTDQTKNWIANNKSVVNETLGNIKLGKAPDKDQIDAQIRESISHGDYESANNLRSGWNAYKGMQVFKGVPPSTAMTQIVNTNKIDNRQPNTQLPNLDANFSDARTQLKMTPQEKTFYKYHLNNLRTVGAGGGVANEDGSISTVKATVVTLGPKGQERAYILPTVWGGKHHDNTEEVIKQAEKSGLDKYPNYGTVDEALKREKQMHDYMEKDVGAVREWQQKNPGHNVQDHAYHPEQQGQSLHLFGSRGMGVGAINAPFKGDLNQTLGGGISANQAFTYLKSKGASDNEARMLIGASLSESNMNPGLWHDGGVGYGLFGHNLKRLDMRGKNVYQQFDAALSELRSRPEHAMVEAAQSPYQLAIAQMHFERPQGYSQNSPQSGHNFTGRLNTLNRMYGLNGGQELPQVAAPADLDTRPRPFSPQQLAADPVLASTYNGILATEAKQQIAYANQTLPAISEGVSRGLVPSTTDMASYIQLASSNPDNQELQKNVSNLVNNVMAHPAAVAAAGYPDNMAHVQQSFAEAAGTGDIHALQMADAYKKQWEGMNKDFQLDPQAFAARPDVSLIQSKPPSVIEGISQDNPVAGLQQVMKQKDAAGIAISSKWGTPIMDATITKGDVTGVTNALLNSDGNSAKKILESMDTVMSKDVLRHFEKDDKFRSALIGMTAADDPEKAKAAYAYLSKRQQENPVAFDQNFKGMDKRMTFWNANITQMSPDEIIKRQRQLTDPTMQVYQKDLEEKAKSEFKKMNYGSLMATAGFVDNSLSMVGLAPSGDIGQRGFNLDAPNQALVSTNDISATPHLIGDFRQAYIEARLTNVDEASATTAAITKVKNNWGMSSVNGNRLMIYPPEKFYSPDQFGSYQWMTDELRNVVADEAAKPGSPASKIPGLYWNPGDPNKPFNSLNPDVQVALHSDDKTRLEIANPYRIEQKVMPDGTVKQYEVKYPPSYGIVVKDKNGQWNALTTLNEKTGKLEPFRFRGDEQARHQNAIDRYNSQRISQGLPGNMSLSQPTPANEIENTVEGAM